jgi:hypothetical protein
VWGFVAMGVLFFGVFWFTIAGAAVPSDLLYTLLVENGHAWLRDGAAALGVPAVVTGLLVDGVYLATAWVIAVMLPPMAIFFPLFTLLEDFGYLPRVAFNLDRLFARAGAHGKQSLTMMMGYGCNAAGVTATRIIDSRRERLIAIITNNFSICNGRWPTLILMGTIFVGAVVTPALAGVVAAGAVIAVVILGIGVTLAVSWALSRTVLRGESSVYSLELPPYRPPRILRTLWTSIIDRTFKVLRRAVVMAAPAGAVIWLVGNVHLGDASLAGHLVTALGPLGWVMGLNGIILLAYLVAVPANEIIIPTIVMLTLTLGAPAAGAGRDARARRRRPDRHRARHHGRLDAADRRQPHDLHAAAPPVQHHRAHHLARDAQRALDGRGHPAAPRPRVRRLRLGGRRRPALGLTPRERLPVVGHGEARTGRGVTRRRPRPRRGRGRRRRCEGCERYPVLQHGQALTRRQPQRARRRASSGARPAHRTRAPARPRAAPAR